MAGLGAYIKILDNFEDALSYQKAQFDRLKHSLFTYAPHYATKIAYYLIPFDTPLHTMRQFVNNMSFAFSNVYASKVVFSWDGKKIIDHFFFAPGSRNTHTVICTSTIGD